MTFISNLTIPNIQLPKINFRAGTVSTHSVPADFVSEDKYTTSTIGVEYSDENKIKQLAKSNPNIQRILKENGIPLKVNMDIISELKTGHLQDSRIVSALIYQNLPKEFQSEIKMETLQQAAMLHDYGKILIPAEILNKKTPLTDKEWNIIQQHSQLGYELLKMQGVNEEVLNLVKYHHQNSDGTGYPKIDKDYDNSLALNIIRAADRYTALREARPYKKPMTKEEALNIIKNDTPPIIYEALLRAVENT